MQLTTDQERTLRAHCYPTGELWLFEFGTVPLTSVQALRMIEMCNSLAVPLNKGPVALETIVHALAMRVETLINQLAHHYDQHERQDEDLREMRDRGL